MSSRGNTSRGGGPRGRGGGDRGGGPRGGGGAGFGHGGPGPQRGGREQRGTFLAPRGRGGPPGSVIYAANIAAQLDSRLSSANHDQLISSLKKIPAQSLRPLRPAYGTLGTAMTLRANFFPVKVPKGPVYDYTVEITPKTDINRLKTRIFQLLLESPQAQPYASHIAHDGAQRLVSAKKLPQPLVIQIPFREEGETQPRPKAKVYTLTVTFSREINTGQLIEYMDGQPKARDYDPLPLISALNLVLQKYAASTGVRVGKNRYFFPSSGAQHPSIGMGLVAMQGFYMSVRPTFKELMVNVNVCMSAFYEPGNLADAIMAFSRNSHGAMPTLPKSFAKGIKVTTRHLGYKMKRPLKNIARNSARTTFFDCEELGGRVSVEEYFKKKYKITLRHAADLPVVDIGSANRNNYIPAELCEIEAGQPYRGKLNDKETANMIKYACNPPRVNAESIVNTGLPILGLTGAASALSGFNISVSSEMAVIPGRQLPPPRLSYKVGQANVRDGSWNILDVKFQHPSVIKSWWVLVVRDGEDFLSGPKDPRLQSLVVGFAEKCKKSGMTVPPGLPNLLNTAPLPPIREDPLRARALGFIKDIINEEVAKCRGVLPSYILVLLAGRDNYIYPGIKRICDSEIGIHTVHMQLPKATPSDPKRQDQYFSNVALKVNTKLGGSNHHLAPPDLQWLTKQKTMVCGIDVTHPSPLSRPGTPSIAAVVASIDDSFVQFPASLRIQTSRREMVEDLDQIMVERLNLYKEKNRVLPDRIIVYRDGVSEGQFDSVNEIELPQILESFKRFMTTAVKAKNKAYRPTLSIIICGKRHHARSFATIEAAADRNGNTRPGTVLDKGITSVYDFDFYLQAHAGLQGTVRSTHYTVVYDENKLGADEIQQGTNSVSYLYARATKSVSLFPAAYYADLACERGRCYINDFLSSEDQTTSSGRGQADRDEEKARVFAAAKRAWGEGVHPNLRQSMFYI